MLRYLIIFITSFIWISCISNKKLIYIQDNSGKDSLNFSHQKFQYKIQPSDVLSIRVQSLDPLTSSFFNLESSGGFNQVTPSSLYLNSYFVDDSGYVALPVLGKIFLKNKTIEEAQSTIQYLINIHLSNSTVHLKLVSFKISVLGEVSRPGYYYIYNNQANIFEALGMAGDITNFGNRNKIKLIRQTNEGSIVYSLDLTNINLLSDTKYFLMPNDIIYVEPLNAKVIRNNLAPLSYVFGGVSALILIINFITR